MINEIPGLLTRLVEGGLTDPELSFRLVDWNRTEILVGVRGRAGPNKIGGHVVISKMEIAGARVDIMTHKLLSLERQVLAEIRRGAAPP